jgi:glycosyltransferase involved in cell wall biosynthesis
VNEKIKILFISKHVIHENSQMAGHRLFAYYLEKFCNDPLFDVGIVVVHKNDNEYTQMEKQFGRSSRNFSIQISKLLRPVTYLFYNTWLRSFLSYFKAQWYYLDPIYALLYKIAISRVKKSGWKPDVVVYEWTEVLFLYNYIQSSLGPSFNLCTEHDVSFIKLERRFGDNKWFNSFLKRFKYAELKALKQMDIVLVLSREDKARLMTNGLDQENIFLLTPFYQLYNISQSRLANTIVYYGAMGRLENQEAVQWFLEKVFIPYSLNRVVRLLIIGSGAPSGFVDKFRHVDNVVFTGFVKSPEEYFKEALCMVVPLTNGGGIKIKVLEAMSCSVAVLTNDIGIEGINAIDKVSYLRCITPTDYQANILMLLNDNKMAREIGEMGRKLILDDFNYENSYKSYRNIITNNLAYKV